MEEKGRAAATTEKGNVQPTVNYQAELGLEATHIFMHANGWWMNKVDIIRIGQAIVADFISLVLITCFLVLH